MSSRKDPEDPDEGMLDDSLLRKSFKLAEELNVGDRILFWELLLMVLEEELKNSGSTLELTEVVAK